MSDTTNPISALMEKVAESLEERTKENLVNRALIDALFANLLSRGTLSRADFDLMYKIGETVEDDDFTKRVHSRLDGIKRYAKI